MKFNRCNHVGCKRFGKFLPKVNLPAQGRSRDDHEPIGIIVELPLCATHVAEIKLTDEVAKLKPVISKQLEDNGLSPCDYDRAFLTRVRAESAEAKRFYAMLAQGQLQTGGHS